MDSYLLPTEAYQEVFQSMSEGIILVDEAGIIAAANPAAEHLFGYEKGKLAGALLESLLPERYRISHMRFRQAFNSSPQPRRMGVGRDLTALRKDGTEFPVEISLSYTKIGGRLMVMAFISDITQRKTVEVALKRSEEQLMAYTADLEKKVEHRTIALNNTIAALECEVSERKKTENEVRKSLEREKDLSELKSKFVSIASHEFRTPLSAVMSSASLIQQYKERGDFEKVDKHITRIKSAVNHLTQILNDFLSLGKLEEGKVEMLAEEVDLDEFFQDLKEEISGFLKDRQSVNVEFLSQRKEIRTDPRILRNVMFNLISNASKYSPADKSIKITYQSTDGSAHFSVQDHGIGIPPEEQKHLFSRFFRATNTKDIQGTGLGLNIVKRYVDLLHGSIAFKSDVDKGTTFYLTMPNH
ncbi:MAG TPA: PAS domain-containing sensor histidine kinase [Chryseosolibacter sp.]|nr:PAS domain-containing sensor histidine kinase [Chryseosolibacter sp.]